MTESDNGAAPAPQSERVAGLVSFDRRMLEALVCPATLTGLGYDAERRELISRGAGLAFPIRDGIPIMLLSEARTLD